jgi:hypothetical protein
MNTISTAGTAAYSEIYKEFSFQKKQYVNRVGYIEFVVGQPLRSDAPMPPPHAAARLNTLLDEWLADDSGEQEATFAILAEHIDAERRRLGMRTLFDAERDRA